MPVVVGFFRVGGACGSGIFACLSGDPGKRPTTMAETAEMSEAKKKSAADYSADSIQVLEGL
ncbi:MAG TPA: hypothetical protein VGE21_11860, partial [Flavobacteriales bacterium]